MIMKNRMIFAIIVILALAGASFMLNMHTAQKDPLLSSIELTHNTSLVFMALPNNTIIDIAKMTLLNTSCQDGIQATCEAYLNWTYLANPTIITRLGFPLSAVNSTPFFKISSGDKPNNIQILMPIKKNKTEEIGLPSTTKINITDNITNILENKGYLLNNGSLLKINVINSSSETILQYYTDLLDQYTLDPLNTTLSSLVNLFSITTNGSLSLSASNSLALLPLGLLLGNNKLYGFNTTKTNLTLDSLGISNIAKGLPLYKCKIPYYYK